MHTYCRARDVVRVRGKLLVRGKAVLDQVNRLTEYGGGDIQKARECGCLILDAACFVRGSCSRARRRMRRHGGCPTHRESLSTQSPPRTASGGGVGPTRSASRERYDLEGVTLSNDAVARRRMNCGKYARRRTWEAEVDQKSVPPQNFGRPMYISSPNSKRGCVPSTKTTPHENHRDQGGERQEDQRPSTVIVVLDEDVIGSARCVWAGGCLVSNQNHDALHVHRLPAIQLLPLSTLSIL